MFLFEGEIAFCNFASLRQNGNKFFFDGIRITKILTNFSLGDKFFVL